MVKSFKKGSTTLFLLLFGMKFFAQSLSNTPMYFVFFTDKNNSNFSINQPAEFLSDRAISRRTKQGISISTQDLPVNSNYIDSVQNAGSITVHYPSKWLNGVLISTTDTMALQTIHQFPFVVNYNQVRIKEKGVQPVEKKLDMATTEKSFFPVNVIPNYPFGYNYKEFKLHNADVLHDMNFTGAGMQIAILDAGFYKANELDALQAVFEEGRVLSTYDFVDHETSVFEDNYHGCAVFSIIAGNVEGVFRGSAPDASYHLIRTENAFSEYVVEEYNWVFGAEYADSAGVDIINTSLGYTEFDNPAQNHTYPDMDGNTTIAAIGADIAASKGILLFTSAGNNGGSLWQSIGTPADADSTIAVGAVDSTGLRAWFSSTGPSSDGDVKPNVVSVGWQKYYINPSDGRVSRGNGTSFSSPFLAGFGACLWQALPEKTNMEIMTIIQESSSQYTHPDSLIGYGIPDFKKALKANTGITSVDFNQNSIENVYPNPVVNQLNIVYQSVFNQTIELKIYAVNGAVVMSETVSVLEGRNLVQLNGIQEVSSGVYTLTITDSTKEKLQTQIVVSTPSTK